MIARKLFGNAHTGIPFKRAISSTLFWSESVFVIFSHLPGSGLILRKPDFLICFEYILKRCTK